MNFGEVIIIFFAMVFGVGAIAILSEHMQKMARIRAEARAKVSDQVEAALQALRQELAELRDTTTKYDLSFDTALQRLEGRVARLEQQAGHTEAAARQGG